MVAAAKARGVEITTLLCTHKHWDHSGGNEAMKKMVNFFLVFCPGATTNRSVSDKPKSWLLLAAIREEQVASYVFLVLLLDRV